MRIGYDAKRAFNNFSGLGNYSRTLIRQMQLRFPDNQYILYTPSVDSELEIPIPENTIIITPEEFTEKLFPSIWRSFGLAGRAQKDKLDIYHGLSNELPSGIAKSGVKSVVTIHDLIFFRYPELYKPIDRMIYRRKLEYCVKSADMIIAVSEQTRNDLLRFSSASPGKITVAYKSCNQSYLI
jgi:hypothetical protein